MSFVFTDPTLRFRHMARFSFLLLALVAVGCQAQSDDPVIATPEASVDVPGTGSPLIQVENATELVDAILEEGNEATVLNFWATWCGPCRIEFPDLMAYDAEMEGEGVEVRFVSVDDPDMMPKVRAFLDEHNVTERSYVSPGNPMIATQLDLRYGASLPTTYVLDSDGIVRAAHVGVISKQALAEKVQGVRDGTLDITTQL